MRRPRLLSLLTALALSCAAAAPLPALGAPAKADKARAAELKQQGDSAMGDLRYADALTAYTQSYELVNDPALLYNRARALQALERFPEALEQIEAFDAQASAKLKARVPALAELIAELRTKVSTLRVDCKIAGARVLLRGKVVGTTPLPGPLRVNAGGAEIEVEADGYTPFRRRVDLPGGGELSVAAKLVPKTNMGVLVVESPVAGARVTIDGKPVGAVPAEASLRAGTHTLVVDRDGYDEARTTAVVAAGERKQVTIRLERTKPIVARWWFWTGVGVVVAGGVALIVASQIERAPGQGDIPPGQVAAPLIRY